MPSLSSVQIPQNLYVLPVVYSWATAFAAVLVENLMTAHTECYTIGFAEGKAVEDTVLGHIQDLKTGDRTSRMLWI